MTLVSFSGMHAGCSPTLLNFALRYVPSAEGSFLLTCCCAVFLLNAAVFVDLALYLTVSVWWSFPALVLSLKLVCCRLEILQHLTWRPRGSLLEVCIIASDD